MKILVNVNMNRTRHMPQRRCIGCNGKNDKKLLLRLIVQPTGIIAFDPTERGTGRGCYLCPDPVCLNKAISRRSFNRAFRQSLPDHSTLKLRDEWTAARLAKISHMPKAARLDLIVQHLESALGAPKWQGCENPLDTLILTVLSQSTNDHNRDMGYERLRQRFPKWEQVMTADLQDIADAIRPAGLANQKSSRIRDILRWIYDTYTTFDLSFLCEQNPDQVKETFLQLKGVGIKTISVVLMFCCGADIFPVDTHVHRICRRLQCVPENATAEKTHELMQPLIPDGKAYSLHMNFLKLGRTICIARKPKCAPCPIKNLCPSAQIE